jgi:hypothetical protein
MQNTIFIVISKTLTKLLLYDEMKTNSDYFKEKENI